MPRITLLASAFGSVHGGTPVTINGTGFLAGAVVEFGGNAGTNVVVHSDIRITCNTPPGAAGDVDVVVRNPDNQAATGPLLFTYIDVPTITALNPTFGPITGGDAVVITGTNFRPGAAVTFAGTAAGSVNVISDTTIQCVSPAGAAGAANVIVTNLDGQSSAAFPFDFVAPPTATAVNPASGPESGGTPVTVTGTGFLNGTTLTFDGAPATNVNVTSATTLNCNVPAGYAGPADVIVTNPDTQSSAPATIFDYVAAPTVSSVQPSSGPETGGTAVTITGTGFAGGAVVTFAGTPATNVIVVSDTSITCNTSAGAAGLANVVVRNLDGQESSPAALFSYIAAPVANAANPASGPESGGTAVSITGTGFLAGARVTFDGTDATNINVIGDTRIDCISPTGVPGTADIVVVNLDGQASAPASIFDYVAAPTVAAVVPASGPAAGGTAVTISGTGFLAGAQVTFAAQPATNVVVASDVSLTCNTPAGTADSADIIVTNADGQASPPVPAFSYVLPPTITSVVSH